MTVFERTTRVDAPLERVWAFHVDVEGLETVSPDWLRLRVGRESTRDDATPAELDVGTELRLSVRPFGIGRRRSWTSRVVEREFEAGRAFFTDRVVEGPPPRWEHRHEFYTVEGGTRLVDRVEYDLPVDPLGGVSSMANLVLAATFAHRHRRTREVLERESPRR